MAASTSRWRKHTCAAHSEQPASRHLKKRPSTASSTSAKSRPGARLERPSSEAAHPRNAPSCAGSRACSGTACERSTSLQAAQSPSSAWRGRLDVPEEQRVREMLGCAQLIAAWSSP